VLRSELTLPFSFSPAQRQPANPLIGQADRGSTMVFAGLTDLSLRRSWEAASGHERCPRVGRKMARWAMVKRLSLDELAGVYVNAMSTSVRHFAHGFSGGNRSMSVNVRIENL
jgi:hypothetical protein